MRAAPTARWPAELERHAPDTVAVWRRLDGSAEGLLAARREIRRRVDVGGAHRLLAQQEAIADALEVALRGLPAAALREPGGEEDWNVAQTFAHTTAARRFLPHWAALAASGRWPRDEPPVVTPSIPGRPDATLEELLGFLAKSRISQARSAEAIEGHERQRCPLEHPLVGHLSCGGWLLFAGVHDLLHLQQLMAIAERFAAHA